MTDVRAAAQLSALASLLTIAVPSLIAFNRIHATLALEQGERGEPGRAGGDELAPAPVGDAEAGEAQGGPLA